MPCSVDIQYSIVVLKLNDATLHGHGWAVVDDLLAVTLVHPANLDLNEKNCWTYSKHFHVRRGRTPSNVHVVIYNSYRTLEHIDCLVCIHEHLRMYSPKTLF